MSARYSDEPKCRLCYHPKVVHRGKLHDGACGALDCPYECKAFATIDCRLPAAPEKGEQDQAHLSNRITDTEDVAHA